jgi:hypothetical protein
MDIEKIVKLSQQKNSRIISVKPVDLQPVTEESSESGDFEYRFILIDEDGVERCMTSSEWNAWLEDPIDSPEPDEQETAQAEQHQASAPANPRKITAVAPLTKASPILGTSEGIDEEGDPSVLRIVYTDMDGVEHTYRAKDIKDWSR